MKAIYIIPNWSQEPGMTIWRRLDFHLVLAIVLSVFVQTIVGDLSWQSLFNTFLLALANDLVLTAGHVYIFYYLDLRVDWLKFPAKRLWMGSLLHSGYSAISFLLVQLIMFGVLFGMSISEVLNWFLDNWWLPIGVTAAVIVLTTTLGFFGKWKEALVEEEKMRTEMMAYKFDSLQNQISPSFVFGSLEGLKKLLDDDPKEAVGLIQQISHLYRSVLETKDMELIPLSNELENFRKYMYLVNFRYGQSVAVSIEVETEPEERIVPSALQCIAELLLECKKELRDKQLSIGKKDVCIGLSMNCDKEDLHELEVDALKNLRQRYAFFTNQEIEMVIQDGGISITLPILIEE